MSQVLQNPLKPRGKPKLSLKDKLHYLKRDIRKMFDEDQRRLRIEKPLRDYLEPIHRRMDREGVPLDERSVILGKKRWPKQYKAGLKRFWGIDIEWVDGHV